MATYNVTFVQGPSRNLQIIRNGKRVDGTPVFAGYDRELAEKFAAAMNAAFAEGKAAQKMETETPLLAAFCDLSPQPRARSGGPPTTMEPTMPVPSLKELIATLTARGAEVRTTEFEGAISTVQILRMPGVSAFPMPAGAAAERMRELVGVERQGDLFPA